MVQILREAHCEISNKGVREMQDGLTRDCSIEVDNDVAPEKLHVLDSHVTLRVPIFAIPAQEHKSECN